MWGAGGVRLSTLEWESLEASTALQDSQGTIAPALELAF